MISTSAPFLAPCAKCPSEILIPATRSVALALAVLAAGGAGGAVWALASVILIHTWQWTPFMFVILLAGLSAISDELYEAAEIDGATSRQSFRAITLPLRVQRHNANALRLGQLLEGGAEVGDLHYELDVNTLTRNAAKIAYEQAGVGPEDLDQAKMIALIAATVAVSVRTDCDTWVSIFSTSIPCCRFIWRAMRQTS